MKTFIATYLFLSWVLPVTADGATIGSIFNVSHTVRMHAKDPAPLHDFYVDLGSRDGLHEGDTLEVSRRMALYQPQWGGLDHVLKVSLGSLKIIAVGESASIARLLTRREPDLLPVTEITGFLIGDTVEAKTHLPTSSLLP